MKHSLVVFIWVAGAIQIYGLINHSGDNFTKDLNSALSHLVHFPFLSLALFLVVYFTNWDHEHFYAVYFTTALVSVRDTSYMHVCVVAEDQYNKWQVSTVGYIIGYSGYYHLIQL